MFPTPDKRRQLRHTALCRDVQSIKQHESYHKDLQQIQRNSELNLQKRQQTAIRREKDLEAHRQDTAEKEANRQKQIEEEQKLAIELYETNRRKINEEKLRQQLRDSNQELRELESKLRAAYVAKGIAAQKAELEAKRLEEQLVARKEQEELERLRLENVDYVRQCQEDEWKRKQELRQVLLNQMHALHRQKQIMYEEFLQDKIYFDEICKRIQEEQFEEIQRKFEMQKRTRKEMEYFQEAKAIWQERQKIAMAEENDRIRVYLEKQEAEQQEMNRRKLLSIQSRERLNEKMVSELQAEFDEARKREGLLLDMYAAEMEERQENRIQQDLEQQLRRRIEARLGLERQIVDIQSRREREADEDRKFKEDQLRQWAERDRIDQMTAAKRRLKISEHRRAIEGLLEDRRRRRTDEVKQMLEQQIMFEEEVNRRQNIIEEERIKLLKEHVTNLLGFLPPGVLRESDREHIPLPKSTK
ncbi:meiosis-specific nuclear structural protein 1-like [Malaya genurostris]|uniref:meiosis-specific nuclear structural protein 1-like n=1 Tax=Malaya genurostris TaxID=325434 RepID=UPI0026F39A7D|nr:meiosis-specific nuclear structural protein 1-like [Malaya genurostris]